MDGVSKNDSPASCPAVAVLGLGIIGTIWANHLRHAGWLAACWNRTARPDADRWVPSAHAAAERANILILVVADPHAVQQVLHAVRPVLTARHLVIQSSTIGPDDSDAARQLVTSCGARYLEAPFTGSKPAAEAQKIVYYLGGDEAVQQEAEPVLQRLSACRIPIGTPRQACAIKLAMNLQIATIAEALCEALHTVRQAGIDDDLFFDCMRRNVSWSGLAALKEPKLRDADYRPQFSIKHLLKDLRLLHAARGELPALNVMIHQLQVAVETGQGDDDFIALYRNLNSVADL